MTNPFRSVRSILLAIFSIATQATSEQIGEKDQALERRMEEVLIRKFSERVNIAPGERDGFIAYARSRLSETRRSTGESYWTTMLIVLGDEATIRDRVKTEEDARYWSQDLISSGSPVAIEVLVPFIFKEEPLVNRMASDVNVISPSHQLASVVLPQILMRSGDFSPKVAEWAKLVWENGKPGDTNGGLIWCRDIMRVWWRENESFFRTRAYKEVRPGLKPPWLMARAPAPEPTPSSRPPATAEPIQPHERSEPPSVEDVRPELMATPMPAKQRADQLGGPWFFAGVGAIASALALAIWIIGLRKK